MGESFPGSWVQQRTSQLLRLVPGQLARSDEDTLADELLSAPFGRCFDYLSDARRVGFLQALKRSLPCFQHRHQYPLRVLCTALEFGRTSPEARRTVGQWVWALEVGLKQDPRAAVNEIQRSGFVRAVHLLDDSARMQLVGNVGAAIQNRTVDEQKQICSIPFLERTVDDVMTASASRLNGWLEVAPDLGGTATALCEQLRDLAHSPVLKLFVTQKDANRKERFLIAVALVLNALRQRFRWMVDSEPDLTDLSIQVRRKYFTVEGSDVMDPWVHSRLQKYNERVSEVAGEIAFDALGEELRTMLRHAFPERQRDVPDDGWAPLASGPVGKALVEFFGQRPDWAIPPHVLTVEAAGRVVTQLGGFEVDGRFGRQSIGRASVAPPAASAPRRKSGMDTAWKPVFAPQQQANPAAIDRGAALQAVAVAAATAAAAAKSATSAAKEKLQNVFEMYGSQTRPKGDENQEALIDAMVQETRRRHPQFGAQRVRACTYRLGEREIELKAVGTELQVVRINGMHVAAMPLSHYLEPHRQQQQQPPQRSAELPYARRTPAGGIQLPGQHSARKRIDWNDIPTLRKLVRRGCKTDQLWYNAWPSFCQQHAEDFFEIKEAPESTIVAFVEKHLADVHSEPWVREILYGEEDVDDPRAKAKKEKKEKKRAKKEKKRARKKRKKEGLAVSSSSSSSSSDDDGQLPAAMMGGIMQQWAMMGNKMAGQMGGQMGGQQWSPEQWQRWQQAPQPESTSTWVVPQKPIYGQAAWEKQHGIGENTRPKAPWSSDINDDDL